MVRKAPPEESATTHDLGRESDSTRFFEDLYQVLRRLAWGYMEAQPGGHTLQPTALVAEAYMRMSTANERTFHSRDQFVAFAARVMRCVLVDHARAKARLKRRPTVRGGALQETGESPDDADRTERILDVDQALHDLEREGELSARAARVVELRFFFGLTFEEIGEALELAPRTVQRDWEFAKAWLREHLGEP